MMILDVNMRSRSFIRRKIQKEFILSLIYRMGLPVDSPFSELNLAQNLFWSLDLLYIYQLLFHMIRSRLLYRNFLRKYTELNVSFNYIKYWYGMYTN